MVDEAIVTIDSFNIGIIVLIIIHFLVSTSISNKSHEYIKIFKIIIH